jgi:hypothetical protein
MLCHRAPVEITTDLFSVSRPLSAALDQVILRPVFSTSFFWRAAGS